MLSLCNNLKSPDTIFKILMFYTSKKHCNNEISIHDIFSQLVCLLSNNIPIQASWYSIRFKLTLKSHSVHQVRQDDLSNRHFSSLWWTHASTPKGSDMNRQKLNLIQWYQSWEFSGKSRNSRFFGSNLCIFILF